MHAQLGGEETREAFSALFPAGLTFKAEGQGWLIEGNASVPDATSPD
jgi:hypothetical protein